MRDRRFDALMRQRRFAPGCRFISRFMPMPRQRWKRIFRFRYAR
jgi:hypothetical protein